MRLGPPTAPQPGILAGGAAAGGAPDVSPRRDAEPSAEPQLGGMPAAIFGQDPVSAAREHKAPMSGIDAVSSDLARVQLTSPGERDPAGLQVAVFGSHDREERTNGDERVSSAAESAVAGWWSPWSAWWTSCFVHAALWCLFGGRLHSSAAGPTHSNMRNCIADFVGVQKCDQLLIIAQGRMQGPQRRLLESGAGRGR